MNIDRLLEILSLLSWFVVIAAGVLFLVNDTRRHGPKEAWRRLFSMRMVVLLLVALSLSVLSASIVFIMPQEAGVVVSLIAPEGYRDQPLRSGLHMLVPWAETPIRYPVYWQTYTMSGKPGESTDRNGNDSIAARTSDGQEVTLDVSVILRIDPEQIVRIHLEWQERYLEGFVRPLVRGVVRTQVAGFSVDEVNSQRRQELEANLDTELRQKLEDKGLILDQFVLRNIAFSPEYAASVEQKQVALQGKTQREYEADQIRSLAAGEADKTRLQAQAEADAQIIQAQAAAEARVILAQAEAEALKLLAASLAENPDLLTYRYIEKLAPGIKVMLVPNNAPLILPVPDLEAGESEALTSTANVTETLTTSPLSTVAPAAPAP